MPADHAPARGDLVWLAFDPLAGDEEAGLCPALAISPVDTTGKSVRDASKEWVTEGLGGASEFRLPIAPLQLTQVLVYKRPPLDPPQQAMGRQAPPLQKTTTLWINTSYVVPTDVASHPVCDETDRRVQGPPLRKVEYPVPSPLVCDVSIAIPMMAGTSPATTKNRGVRSSAACLRQCLPIPR